MRESSTISSNRGAEAPRRRPGMSRWRKRHHRKGWLYVVPALALFCLMIVYPIVRSLHLSFYDYSILEPDSSKFVGLANYAKLLTIPSNQRPFGNTLYFTALFVPPYVIGALLLALALNAIRRGAVALRTMLFTPVVVSLAVSAVMWTLFYNPGYGFFEQILRPILLAVNYPGHFALVCFGGVVAAGVLVATVGWHLRWSAASARRIATTVLVGLVAACGVWPFVAWGLGATDPGGGLGLIAGPNGGVLGDPDWAMIGIAILCVWNGIGINVILFLVGLQRISEDLYEAGMVDGANAWQRFWHITMPQLRPTIYLVLILSLIGAFKVFGQPFIMTRGGPANATLTYVMRLYNLAFVYGRFQLGYASALAYALALFIFVFSLLTRRLNRPVD